MPSMPAASLAKRLATGLAAGIALTMVSGISARADDATPAKPVAQNDLLDATLWMQKSVEYKATAEGIYDLAKMRLDQALADKSWTALPDMESKDFGSEPVAIITDLDETAIDNNVYEASLVTRNTDFSGKEWDKYVKDEDAKAVPGAVDFFKYAASKGVTIFYISNRTGDEEKATRENMQKLGFPIDDKVDTFLFEHEKPDWKSAKGSRDEVVAKGYRVVLMLGDNMGDFTDKYDGTPDERLAAYKADMGHWGHDWIMLPNPEYGSWESASFGNDWKKPADERRKEKIQRLDAWSPSK